MLYPIIHKYTQKESRLRQNSWAPPPKHGNLGIIGGPHLAFMKIEATYMEQNMYVSCVNKIYVETYIMGVCIYIYRMNILCTYIYIYLFINVFLNVYIYTHLKNDIQDITF